MWCNGTRQETWGPATCAVQPQAHPLTTLCPVVLISNMGVTILENALTAQHLNIVTHLILVSSGLDYAVEETLGSERLRRLPKVTQLVSIQTQIWSWAGSTASPKSWPVSCPVLLCLVAKVPTE